MAKPWEKYQATQPVDKPSGPWDKYAPADQFGNGGEPGAIDAGAPPPKTLIDTGKEGLGAAAKGLDVLRGNITAPMLAAFLGTVTGKDVYRGAEHLDAINPTNLKTFPKSAELYERAGVPEGAKMSDVVGGYGKPGESPWYQPEKGGPLDFSVRGAGGLATDIAIDPVTYLSMGASAEERVLAETASQMALKNAAKKGVIAKTMEMGARPFEAIGEGMAPIVQKIKNTKVGRGVINMAAAPSDALKAGGKKLYNSVLVPVEHEGSKFGKTDIGETLYNAGISSPENLRAEGGEAANVLLNERNKILTQADEAGAKVGISDAMAGTREQIAKLRDIGDSDANALADSLESKIKEWEQTEKGVAEVPSTPASTKEIQVPMNDGTGASMSQTVTTPGTPGAPGIAPKPYTTSRATKLKSFLYEGLPKSQFQQDLITPTGAKIQGSMSGGLKTGVENAVADTLGAEKGAAIQDLNAEAGKILSTRKSMTRVENNADRVSNNLTSLNGTDKFVAGLGTVAEHGDIGGGAKALTYARLLDWLRLRQMPAGYAMRKLGEGGFTGPAIDAVTREKFKKYMGYGSRGEQNGQE